MFQLQDPTTGFSLKSPNSTPKLDIPSPHGLPPAAAGDSPRAFSPRNAASYNSSSFAPSYAPAASPPSRLLRRNSGSSKSFGLGRFDSISSTSGKGGDGTTSPDIGSHSPRHSCHSPTGRYGRPSPKQKKGSRIDPAQMPRPAQIDPEIVKYYTHSGATRRNPPLSNASFRAIDNGNCSPRFMRITTTEVPINATITKECGISLGVVATPLAWLENDESPVPVVDFQSMYITPGTNTTLAAKDAPRPPRCTRCQAYVNAAVRWDQDGNVWECNLCAMINQTPSWYDMWLLLIVTLFYHLISYLSFVTINYILLTTPSTDHILYNIYFDSLI